MTQETSAPAGAVVAPPPKNRRGLLLRLLVAVIVLVAIGWTVWYFVDGRWYEETDDAYVQGNVVQITPQVPGTVISIGADDGDLVHEGDVLVKLDPSDADVALAGAKADLANTVRKVRGLYNNVTSAQADVSARQIAVDKARADFNRRRDLAASGAISAEELAHARDALTSAESALSSSTQQFNNSKVLVDDTVVSSHPDVQAASAKLRAAYLDDIRATLLAPVTGYIAKRSVQVGQRVQPGSPLMAVVPLHQVWIDANFKETQLGNMRIGQPVEIKSDLYGSSVKYKGKVQSLGIGSGSAFSLLPAQNATGNWIKVVQRVPVRIALDDADLVKHPLRIGLSTDVTIDITDDAGNVLAQAPIDKPVAETAVYDQVAAKADAEADAIVQANLGAVAAPAN